MKRDEFQKRAFPELRPRPCSCSALSLTRVPVVGHPELPLQGPIVPAELQLQHGVVPHFPPLDVDRGLLLARTVREMLSPVLLIQLSFSWRGGKAGHGDVLLAALTALSFASRKRPSNY